MTSHYLNQWWSVYWCIYASLGLSELRTKPFISSLLSCREVASPNMLCWIYFGKHIDIFAFSTISLYKDGTGSWNLYPGKITTYLSYIVMLSITVSSGDHHCIPNHWQLYCFVTAHSVYHQRNTKAPYCWSFQRGIHRWLVDSPHKGPVRWKAIPCHNIIKAFIMFMSGDPQMLLWPHAGG